MINNCILIGRLTRDIELRYTNENKAVGNFTIAVNRRYKNQNGEYESDFIDCVIFGKQAENMRDYTHKGDLIGVEGSIQKRNYENKEGKKVYVTEIMVSNISFLSTSKKKEEKNEYEDMSIKTESKVELDSDVKLPWEE